MLVTAIAPLCLAQGSAGGNLPPAPASSLGDYAGTVWDDASAVFVSPANWQSGDWLEFGAATAGVVGTAVLLDRPVRDAALRNAGNGAERFANRFEKFGAEYSFGVLGVFYVEGLAAHDPLNRLVAEDGLAASAISGTLTFVLKEAFGRSRPIAGRGVFHFATFSGNASFPSGHTTQAFAVASVIAARYGDNPWIDSAAYGIATLVGVARIDHRAHFASDVLAGALIGHTIGRIVVRERNAPAGKISFAPMLAPHFVGLGGDVEF